MQVFIVRHGKADALPGEYPDDNLRPLTEAGKEEMYQFALIWKKMGIVFDKLVSSPLVRARQTAEMIALAYGWKNKIAEEDALGHDYSVGNVLSMLNKFHGKKKGIQCKAVPLNLFPPAVLLPHCPHTFDTKIRSFLFSAKSVESRIPKNIVTEQQPPLS